MGRATTIQTKFLPRGSAAPLTGVLFGIVVWLLAEKLASFIDGDRSE